MGLSYNQEVKAFGKKDGFIALCVVVLFSVLFAVAVYVVRQLIPEGLTEFQSNMVDISIRIFMVGVAITIAVVKKQGLASMGFHKDNFMPMLRFTLLLFLAFSVFGVVPGLIFGWELNNIATIIPALLTTFILAAGEDIFYVGFMQTRLHGLIKNNVLAILTGAVFFMLAHLPQFLIGGQQSSVDLAELIIVWFIGHSFLVLVFRRHFSIIPVMLVHTLANFYANGRLWSELNLADNMNISVITYLSVFIVLLIMEIVRWRRQKKTSAK